MSQVIKQFLSGGETPRLYRRGNDDVDKDTFLGAANSGFNAWLDSQNFNDKQRQQVTEAFRNLYTEIDSGRMSARIGGGFTGSNASYTNAKKGFDAYGYAAGYLGDKLREQRAYRAPVVPSTKIKYTSTGFRMPENWVSEMIGTSLTAWQNLDPLNSDGTRGTTVRGNTLADNLERWAKYMETNGEFESEDQKNAYLSLVRRTAASLRDGVSENEWYSLERLGLSNMDRYFATTTTTQQGQPGSPDAGGTNPNGFLAWVDTNYPVYTGTLKSYNLSGQWNYNTAYVDRLISALNGADTEELHRMFWTLINLGSTDNPGYLPLMKKTFGGTYPGFSRQYLMKSILEALATRGGVFQESSDGVYYIPHTYDKNTATAWVWSPSTNMIYLKSVHDIPYWQNRIQQEYQTFGGAGSSANPYLQQRYPGMYAKGGVLKALLGTILDAITWLPEDLTDDRRLRNTWDAGSNSFTLSARGDSGATDNSNPGNGQYDPESHGSELEQLQYYRDWQNLLTSNLDLARAWATRYKALSATGMSHANSWFDAQGNFNFEAFKASNPAVWSDGVNGIGHDIYRGRVYQIHGQDGYYSSIPEGYELVPGDPTLGANGLANIYQLRQARADIDPTGDDVDSADEDQRVVPPPGSQTPGAGSVSTDERHTGAGGGGTNPARIQKPGFSSFMFDFAPDFVSAGRLFGSIYNNNKIADIVRKSLKPALLDTYELYSPVTGAFGEMSLRNRQGADIMRRASMPFTSDASLHLAGLMDAGRQNSELQYQGFLADDKEIKRTQQEALGRVEGNVARRSDTANKNRASIIANDQAIAQLEASRRKQNWNSWDSFLQGVEGRWRTRLQDERTRRNQYALDVANQSALQDYQSALAERDAELAYWRGLDEANKTAPLPQWYKDWSRDITNWYLNSRLKSLADIMGYSYSGPAIVRPSAGTYRSFREGGKLSPSTNQLLTKIIRGK